MKAILEFDLDEQWDRVAHKKALQGSDYSSFVHDYWNDVIRQMYKYGIPEDLKDSNELLEHMRTQFLELLHSYNLKTDD